MARKKTRSVDGGGDSIGSQEKYDSKGNCPHIVKGVDIGGLKKAWKKKEDVSCQVCKRKQLSTSKKTSGVEVDVWVCMNCGHVGCGNGRHCHGMSHFNTSFSDCHSVVAIVDTWTLRCLQCRLDINLDVNGRASDAIAFLKKNFIGSPVLEEVAEEKQPSNLSKKQIDSSPTIADHKMKYRNSKELKVYPMLGLENLGNTCYLNAVLQCLTQTPTFVTSLELCCQSKSAFQLPGGKNLIPTDRGDYLPPLEGVLGEGGQLSKAVHRVLDRVRSGATLRKTGLATENPGEVIRLMKKLSNTFYIGEQHDSHELLRFLLEGLRTEDLKRYQRGILNAMNISPTKEVFPKQKETLIAYKNQAILKKLVIERIFGGSFISLLKCLECNTVTSTFENFMDISLPVESEKVKTFEKQALATESRVSKYQQKKDRKLARRSKKKSKGYRAAVEVPSAQAVNKHSHSSNGSASESEADVEDNLDVESATCISEDDRLKAPDASPRVDFLTSSKHEDIVASADEVNFKEASSESEKVYPYTELLFGSNHNRCSELIGQTDAYNDLSVCNNQIGSEFSIPESSCSPESSPIIYGCGVERSPMLYGSPEHSLNGDFGSCEGGRGSPASSIEQADWEQDEEEKKEGSHGVQEHVLVEEVEAALQMSQELESINSNPNDQVPPEPFEFISSESFKEESLLECVTPSYHFDPLNENLNNFVHLEKDYSFNHLSAYGENDGQRSIEGLLPEANHLPCVFDADKQEIPDEAFEILVEEVVGVGKNDSEETKEAADSGNASNNVISDMKLSDGSMGNWGATLAPPSEQQNVIYSLDHCLRQFFNEEILSGPNKIGCAHCTRLKKGRNPGNDEALIQTNALKQLLFLKLPKVLTIHLKRFEVIGTRMSKITRKITFPVELDVSPYTCVKIEANSPNKTTCYHLYGVIEHSGHMTSGHYVAYVKAQEGISGGCDQLDQGTAHEKGNGREFKECKWGDGEKTSKVECPPSDEMAYKWYYISDTYVKEVSEKEVLGAEAYILFYRQI